MPKLIKDGITYKTDSEKADLFAGLLSETFKEDKMGFIETWKLANIMIPKKGRASSDVGEYRGISLLSNISKLIERIIKNRLYKHLEENKILNIFQSGFRDKRSATDNLFNLTQTIRECFQKKSGSVEFFTIYQRPSTRFGTQAYYINCEDQQCTE